MTVTEALQHRRATPHFDPSAVISREELLAIMDTASLAPSSSNLQPWAFLILESEADRRRLWAVSYEQPKILEAPVVVVVLGNYRAHIEHGPQIVDSQIANGYLKPERREQKIADLAGGWDHPVAQMTEAFRGSSLWSMAFMLAAEEAGWNTAPMGGYKPDELMAEFGVPDTYFPTMIICVGKADASRTMLPRNVRFAAADRIHVGNWA
ncbi:MAG: nitroreductase family protein [Fimbriimonadaceae bacterium]|nr:nitroreductase family protein [Fimbriimonadaceae bacterium]